MKMRQTLHRAQMLYSDEWVVGNVNFYPDINRAFIRLNQVEMPSQQTALEVEVKKETVSEFTGKFDKNGNKIFENHICRFYGDEGEFADYVIKWDEKKCRFVSCELRDGVEIYDDFDDFFCEHCVITGDIFSIKR